MRVSIVYLGLLAEYQGTPHLLQAMQYIRGPLHHDVLSPVDGLSRRGVLSAAGGGAACARPALIFTGRVFYEEAAQHLALGAVAVAS